MVLCTECKRCTFGRRNNDIIAVCSAYDEIDANIVFDDCECRFYVPVDANYPERNSY